MRRCRRGVCVQGARPGPALDGLIDDVYYLERTPPYSRLLLPTAPAPLLNVNLGAPFLIRTSADLDDVEYADGCVVTIPTRVLPACSAPPWSLVTLLATHLAEVGHID